MYDYPELLYIFMCIIHTNSSDTTLFYGLNKLEVCIVCIAALGLQLDSRSS